MILTLLATLLISPAHAGGEYTCHDLFDSTSIYHVAKEVPNKTYFDPWDGDSVSEFLSFPKVTKAFKKIDKTNDNLSFYEDHAKALTSALKILIQKMEASDNDGSPETSTYRAMVKKELKILYAETLKRRIDKKMTYYWLWTISFKASSVKEAFDNLQRPDFVAVSQSMALVGEILRLEQIKFANDYKTFEAIVLRNKVRTISDGGFIRHDDILVMPVLARLTYKNFLETENSFDLVAFPFELHVNHNHLRLLYSDSTQHDLTHAANNFLSRERAGKFWPEIHEEIYSRIKQLSGKDLIYTAYVYGYLLRELLRKRSDFVDIVTKNPDEPPVMNELHKKTLLRRLQNFNDLGQDFPEVEDKNEIIQVGLENLTRILYDMRATRN